MAKAFPFLRIPLELREEIYSLYFHPASRLLECDYYGGGRYRFDFDLYRVNKQVYIEAQTVFRRENVFVRIETPWPQAVNHITTEGLVPIVAVNEAADDFRYHHGLVQITAPAHLIAPPHSIIVLLDDLHLFCQVWFYSALNYETLNHHLRVAFTIQDPYYPADPKPIAVSIQKRLLLPFGQVKELDEVEVIGYDEHVKEELERLMAIPYDTPQQCCETATELMELGDRAIRDGKAQEALELYVRAFHALHIIIVGRTRKVLADQFFHKAILGGRYQGQTGTTVRIILRIMLVSRVVNAYLKLHCPEEATFWGMRTIKMMRSTVGSEFEDFLMGVACMLDVGLIYLRTGIALRRMEDSKSDELHIYAEDQVVGSAEVCFKMAKRFLKGPHQKLIKEELEEHNAEVHETSLLDRDDRSDVDSMAPMSRDDADEDSVTAGQFSVSN